MAIDIDRNFLEVAWHRLSESGATNCEFVVGDAYELTKLAPRPAEFVFMANAFHGVPDRARLARAVRDVLMQFCRFAIVNWHQRMREQTTILGEIRGPETKKRMSPEQAIKAVASNGLKFSQLVEVPPSHYGIVFEQSPG